MSIPQWQLFEQEMKCLLTALGYSTELTQPSHDKGVDIFAQKNGRTIIVQCKRYGTTVVGGPAINQLEGTRKVFNADGAMCITTGTFTRDAEEFATLHDFEMVDRKKLISLCSEGRKLTVPSLTALKDLETDKIIPLTIAEPLSAVDYRIGNGTQCFIRLTDTYALTHQATIRRHGVYLAIRDCGGKGQVSVNKSKINETLIPLTYGDTIRISEHFFKVVFCLHQ